MKEQKFLALLNLYLDGGIDPASVAELEQEILSNAQRRRTYTDYCRIHRATKLIYQQFRTAADDNNAASANSTREVELTPADKIDLGRRAGGGDRRPFRVAAYVATGLVAACAVIVLGATLARSPGVPTPAGAAPTELATSEPVVAPVAATEPVTPAPNASFPAPFAPELRSDPYIVELTSARHSPFTSLVNWTSSLDAPGAEAAMVEFPSLRLQPVLLQPATDTFRVNAGENRPLSGRLFRSRLDDRAEATEAVGFEIQR